MGEVSGRWFIDQKDPETVADLVHTIAVAGASGRAVADVPPQYGSWSAVYALFRRWQRDGTWARILTATRQNSGPGLW
jgi:transposase